VPTSADNLQRLFSVLSTDKFSTLNAPYFSVTVPLSALIFCQANQRISFKDTFCSQQTISKHLFANQSYNGQLSAPNLPRPTDQINGSYILKVTCPALSKSVQIIPRIIPTHLEDFKDFVYTSVPQRQAYDTLPPR
jgi:hypothetical protein